MTYEKRALDGIAPSTPNAPCAEEKGKGDCNAYKHSVHVADFREGGDPPQEVDRSGYD